jgi:hypothetical protein
VGIHRGFGAKKRLARALGIHFVFAFQKINHPVPLALIIESFGIMLVSFEITLACNHHKTCINSPTTGPLVAHDF